MNSEINGLYVHIPFCDGKCHYCAFYSVGYTPERADAYLDALEAELMLTAARLAGIEPLTIFFGGGTPTLLAPGQMQRLGEILRSGVDVGRVQEWTAEANPGSLDEEKMKALTGIGVNRVSLGVQAFDDHVLRLLGRRHTVADIEEACALIGAAGITNWGLDLIACVPGVSSVQWRRALKRAAGMRPKHISVYALTVEEGTELSRRAGGGRFAPLDDDAQLHALHSAERLLGDAGYQRYEISNYAQPGCACRHNVSCWRGENYIGLGCAAASHVGPRRWTNAADIGAYIAAGRGGRPPPCEAESLTPAQRATEMLVFGLRMAEGVNLAGIAAATGLVGTPAAHGWTAALRRLRREGLVRDRRGQWLLTGRGRDLADHVAVELMN